MLAADTQSSFGSLAKYKDTRRLKKIGQSTIIGASGEMSDFQTILEVLEGMESSDAIEGDGYVLKFNVIRSTALNLLLLLSSPSSSLSQVHAES
jgi:20S proteasome subunit beta 7